jgi:hypothetical protein
MVVVSRGARADGLRTEGAPALDRGQFASLESAESSPTACGHAEQRICHAASQEALKCSPFMAAGISKTL